MELIQLVYLSKALRPFLLDELRQLVDHASLKNRERDITGMLLYSGGYFLQALEGEPQAVQTLYDQIARDPRHIHVREILRVGVNARNFTYWGMRLLSLEHTGEVDVERLRQLAHGVIQGEKTRSAGVMLQCMRDFCAQMPATVRQTAGPDMISNLSE